MNQAMSYKVIICFCFISCFSMKQSIARPKKQKHEQLRLFHYAPQQANRNRRMSLSIRLRGPWEKYHFFLRFRRIGKKRYKRDRFLRGYSRLYGGDVPKEMMSAPGVEYYIEAVEKKPSGRKPRTLFMFATAQKPHRVLVKGFSQESKAKARMKQHGGFRSTVGLVTRFHYYGSHGVLGKAHDCTKNNSCQPDYYYNLEVFYQRRFKHALYHLNFGFGHFRGFLAPVLQEGVDFSQAPTNTLLTGIDYGFSSIYLDLWRYFGLDMKILLGGSDRGFEIGFAATMRIGRLMETHLDLGAEFITYLGYKFFFELAWDTVPRCMMSLRAEASTLPVFSINAMSIHAFYSVLWKAHARFFIQAKVGYGRRNLVTGGGPIGELNFFFNF